MKLNFFCSIIYFIFIANVLFIQKNVRAYTCTNIQDLDRQDCYPEKFSNETLCLQRGCCWKKPSRENDVNLPYCFYPTDYNGYLITSKKRTQNYISLHLNRHNKSGFPSDFRFINIDIVFLNENSLRIKIYPRNERRYEVPIDLDLNKKSNLPTSQKLYDIEIDDSKIHVKRRLTNQNIWSGNYKTLILSDQFLQISTDINSRRLFGLGEHKDDYEKTISGYKRYVFFNKDHSPTENYPTYGSHPVYLSYEKEFSNTSSSIKTLAHSVFLLNSNAIELVTNAKPNLIWRSLGGIFDFFINLGETPEQAVSKYISLVGKPPIPPAWALGFHLCRFGYNSLEKTKEVFERTRKAGIPFDVQWNDIDFMDQRNMYTIDNKRFAGLDKFVDELHSLNMKYVIIFDPGLGTNFSKTEYPNYYEGLDYHAYILNQTNQILEAKVWNKYFTSFVDFTKDNGSLFWQNQMKKLHDKIQFDGSWIDMNEISAFNNFQGSRFGCDLTSSYENPYYIPKTINPLIESTICMNSKLALGTYYNLKNVYCYFEARTVNKALKSLKKRPFIISRSTYPGLGKYASHWSGDIQSDWDNLKYSIANMLEFNILGIPLVGSDICGFNGNTTKELCARWTTVGAFYPFSRNHNSYDAIEQDPVALGPDVVNAAKYALKLKYSLVSAFYTEFYFASQLGLPVVKSLSLVFPDEDESYKFKNQFLWGNCVLIVPILEPQIKKINAYFPKGIWYNYVDNFILSNSSVGTNFSVEIDLDSILVVVRGGCVLPTHKPSVTITETRSNNITLIVALDNESKASGYLYYDDGESFDIEQTKKYTLIEFSVNNNLLTSKVLYKNYLGFPKVDTIRILGLRKKVQKVFLSQTELHFNQNGTTLFVNDLDLNLLDGLNLEWQF